MNKFNPSKNEVFNFQYVISINQKVIIEFLESRGYSKKDLNIIDVYFLSFLVNVSKNDLYKSTYFENQKYFLIMNNLIIKNLIFLNIGSRQIGNIINKLENLDLLKRYVENKTLRYLKVNDEILNSWYIHEDFSNIEKLQKFEPEKWRGIINEFGNEKDFELWVISFSGLEINFENIPLQSFLNSLYQYLKTCRNNTLKTNI